MYTVSFTQARRSQQLPYQVIAIAYQVGANYAEWKKETATGVGVWVPAPRNIGRKS